MNNRTKVILSIKPEFANKIFSGEKKYEFRKRIFSDTVTHVIVYATNPISKVIGQFKIDSILFRDVESLWDFTKEHSGITEDYFRKYFKDKQHGYAIKIRSFNRYKKPLCIKDKFGIAPPQSFAYVK